MRFALVVVLAACHAKSDVPSCEAVGGQFYRIATDDLRGASVDAKTQRMVKDQLPAMRDELVIACKDTQWAPAVRTCMGSAANNNAFTVCETQLTSPQRSALDRGAAVPPPAK